MNLQKFLNFRVKYYSPDGKDSPVFDYLLDLFTTNAALAKEALTMLQNLPKEYYLFTNIKPFRHGNFRCYELRVKCKNDICRFFFTIEEPHFIVVYGFTKKSQKTENRDIARGEKNLDDYRHNKIAILIDTDISKMI